MKTVRKLEKPDHCRALVRGLWNCQRKGWYVIEGDGGARHAYCAAHAAHQMGRMALTPEERGVKVK